MSGRLLAGRPMLIETVSIGQIDVEPSIVVIVEEGNSAALGLKDDSLAVHASPDIWAGESGLRCYVDELNRRGRRCGDRSMHRVLSPFPQRGCENVEKSAAKGE